METCIFLSTRVVLLLCMIIIIYISFPPKVDSEQYPDDWLE
jgi:hypothetical protein